MDTAAASFGGASSDRGQREVAMLFDACVLMTTFHAASDCLNSAREQLAEGTKVLRVRRNNSELRVLPGQLAVLQSHGGLHCRCC